VLDPAIRVLRSPLLAALVGAVFLHVGATGCGSGGGGATATGDAGAGGGAGSAGTGGGMATGSGGGAGGAGRAGSTGAGGVGSGGTSASTGRGGSGATGGSVATGGVTGAGGGAGRGSGGNAGAAGSAAGTGGAAAAGGKSGLPPPQPVLNSMSPGWNLGNSFDATPNETSWGNPTPNQTLIKAVHAAGFNTLRIPVTWTNHLGGGPSYTIDSAWMAKVTQTAQWAIDAGMYVFVNTHHDADGQWITFPETASAAATVAAEVKAVWTQIATAFKAFDARLMLECFNEPHNVNGNDAATQTDLDMYLEACVNAIRGTGGANATRLIMIQPVGASPIQDGIQAMMNASIITDPNLLISIHTYYPTNFGLSTTPYAWGSADDYTSMRDSIAQQLRVWLPTQPIVIGEWGSEGAQATANRTAHALAYSQDVTTAGMVPVWWDNGGSGSGSYALFNRSSGAETYAGIVTAIMTGVKNGQAMPNNWATP
jgi:endoglucanase